MAVYYIDPINGVDLNNGLQESVPIKSNREIDVKPGDTVLFKRGSMIRDALWNVDGEPGAPITYGAYGEGENPVFCGSVDVSGCENWVEVSENIWKCIRELKTEVCNFVFEQSFCGALRWEKEDLKEQGDWWDNCFGYGNKDKTCEDHTVLMYSEKNPGEFYHHIECVQRENRFLARNGHHVRIQDITFRNNGVHAVAGVVEPDNVTIENCRFEFIGGSVWSKELKIRFGNGVECWDAAEDIIVRNCVFYEIYDSGFTHQGGGRSCKPAKRVDCSHNIFIKCGMAAYEQRDVLPESLRFCDNICMDAGKGFSGLGEVMPRKSEIWPQPMGHHIFLWRISQSTQDANFEIKNNVFLDAPYGAAIYSIIAKEAEEQIDIDNNTYYMQQKTLLNRYMGEDYTSFAAYREACKKELNSYAIERKTQ